MDWGAGIVDLDNDGLPDLFLATGMVYPEVERKLPEYPYKTPRVVFRNLGGGKFEELLDEAGPGVSDAHCSRGVAFGDFDNDGDVDILIMNMNEPPSLLRNDMKGDNHWLKVLLTGVESNRSAIGAQVVAAYGDRKQAQAVLAQSSYLSVSDRRLHFGLGSRENSRSRNSLAERQTGESRWRGRGSVGGDPRRLGNRADRQVREVSGVRRSRPRRGRSGDLPHLHVQSRSLPPDGIGILMRLAVALDGDGGHRIVRSLLRQAHESDAELFLLEFHLFTARRRRADLTLLVSPPSATVSPGQK